MSKKYLRPGGMCQFFDEHYHYQGGIDWDRLEEDPFGRSTSKKPDKQPEEPYYAMIERIMAKRAEKAKRDEQN